MNQLTDELLVREVQEGNIPAFGILVSRYQRKLTSFVVSIIRDSDAAQDLVQEAFIHLYKTIERVDIAKKFSSYLYAITRNKAISFLRSKKTHVSLSAANEVISKDSPERQYEQAHLAKEIESLLEKIDNKYRKVITLYYYDNLSYEQIGKLLQIPINTVRTHLKRAKRALKALV